MKLHQPDGEGARIYEQVPQLARIRRDVLLGDVWKQPELSYRDRILVTCSVLAATGKLDELKIWMARGVEAGITLDELRGLVVQVTFYAGWPAGLCAGRGALALFEAGEKQPTKQPKKSAKPSAKKVTKKVANKN